MGAPAVISSPTKSYVAINSNKTDRSIPPTMCDLGRVSSIAAAVILPRTSNFVARNSSSQNTRSIPHKKRPTSEVLGHSNSTALNDNTSSTLSTTNQPSIMDSHANRSGVHGNQSSIQASATSTVENNPDRRHDSTSQAKRIKLESTVTTPRLVSSLEANTADNQKNITTSVPEKAQMIRSTQYHTSQSTNLHPQKTSLMPVQLSSQETKAEPHKNQHHRIHTQNTFQLPNQQAVPLLTPGMGNLPSQVSHSIGVQIQQQNQQLHSTTQLPNQQAVPLLTPRLENLPTHVSHSIGVQLQQQNQQLRNTTQLPNQQAVPLLTPGMENLPTQVPHSIRVQLQQQNQQLCNTTQLPNQQAAPLLTTGMGNLPTQVSHSIGVQLQQQNQQLRNENILLQKQLSLFRQLTNNPQRLSQVLARLEQRVH